MESTAVLSLAQKVFIVKHYYKSDENMEAVLGGLKTTYNIRMSQDPKNVAALHDLIQVFEARGTITKMVCYAREPKREVVEVVAVESEEEDFGADISTEEIVVSTEIEVEQDEQPTSYSQEDIEGPAPRPISTSSTFRDPSLPVKKIYRCKSCPKIFGEKEHLLIHASVHSAKEKLEKCEFMCHECGKELRDRKAYASHKLLHSGERPFKCTLCPKTYPRSTGLLVHMRTHTGERPYHCQYCEGTFATHTSRQLHERRHTGEKPYECHHCSERFIGKSALNIHLRTHTGEYVFQCQLCENRFKTAKTHQDHLKAKHNVSVSNNWSVDANEEVVETI